MATRSPTFQKIPLKMVGGSLFGRYPKISQEQTWNMIVSDNFLVPYAGYEVVAAVSPSGEGRGIYASTKYDRIILVADRDVFVVDTTETESSDSEGFPFNQIGTLETSSGEVYIAENNGGQIAIVDLKNIYIFNYIAGTFEKVTFSDPDDAFTPSYIAFQNGQFVAGVAEQASWRLSDFNDGSSDHWPNDANHVGEFETKPNNVVATVPIPGQSGLLYVFGDIVVEPWVYTGEQLFPYQKNTYFNIDYGCLSAATIATLQNLTVWLAGNEKTGATIMYTNGGVPQRLSTDGIDFKLAQVAHPERSYGFLFRQDGHMIYQLTFDHPDDNFSITYDFNTQLFFNTCNEKQEAHIAKRVVYFNNRYYFISFIDGNLYELNSLLTTYNGEEIPRMRICPTVRLPDNSPFITNNLTFIAEQGEVDAEQRIDMNISFDGGYNFGNTQGLEMNALAHRQNRVVFWVGGRCNEFIPQFKFWGTGRFVIGNGEVNIYQ